MKLGTPATPAAPAADSKKPVAFNLGEEEDELDNKLPQATSSQLKLHPQSATNTEGKARIVILVMILIVV